MQIIPPLAVQANWQTPTVLDGEGRPYTYPNGNHDQPFLTLLGQARYAWNTPSAQDCEQAGSGKRGGLTHSPLLAHQ